MNSYFYSAFPFPCPTPFYFSLNHLPFHFLSFASPFPLTSYPSHPFHPNLNSRLFHTRLTPLLPYLLYLRTPSLAFPPLTLKKKNFPLVHHSTSLLQSPHHSLLPSPFPFSPNLLSFTSFYFTLLTPPLQKQASNKVSSQNKLLNKLLQLSESPH